MDNLPSISEVVKNCGLVAKKSLGQNFLFDLNITKRIARCAGDLAGCNIIEIGPGPGALTRGLLMSGATNVIVIEKDQRFIPALNQISAAYPEKLHIVNEDALLVSEAEILKLYGQGHNNKIVANLPYNIATVLLFKWLEQPGLFSGMTLMFQKEVTDRICADPGNKTYGRLSVMTQFNCAVDPQFDLSPQVFFPPPKITSTLINITPHQTPQYDIERNRLGDLCKYLFSQRRKTLRALLKGRTSSPAELLAELGIKETARPEELSVALFVALAKRLG